MYLQKLRLIGESSSKIPLMIFDENNFSRSNFRRAGIKDSID